MNTRFFVGGSSLILATWLGATFFNEVPAQRYPKLNTKTVKIDETNKTVIVSQVPTLMRAVAQSR
jgi:hypothetical protein